MENRVRQEYIDALGEEFGREFHAIWSEWCLAKLRYEELRELFGTQETCDLLNAVSPAFFGDIQRLFWNDLMLYVTRLTDKSEKALKVRSLERFLTDDTDLLKQVRKHRENADRAAKPVADWRNRRIAHTDRALLTDKTRPLASVKLDTCSEVLDHVHAVLNAIQLHRMNSSIANMIAYSPTSGELVAYLKRFVESVCFIASIISPENPYGFDLEKGRAFLRKLGRSEPGDSNKIYDLMDTARRVCRQSL